MSRKRLTNVACAGVPNVVPKTEATLPGIWGGGLTGNNCLCQWQSRGSLMMQLETLQKRIGFHRVNGSVFCFGNFHTASLGIVRMWSYSWSLFGACIRDTTRHIPCSRTMPRTLDPQYRSNFLETKAEGKSEATFFSGALRLRLVCLTCLLNPLASAKINWRANRAFSWIRVSWYRLTQIICIGPWSRCPTIKATATWPGTWCSVSLTGATKNILGWLTSTWSYCLLTLGNASEMEFRWVASCILQQPLEVKEIWNTKWSLATWQGATIHLRKEGRETPWCAACAMLASLALALRIHRINQSGRSRSSNPAPGIPHPKSCYIFLITQMRPKSSFSLMPFTW